jgi:4-amino-4-deoxy-L-arabinose transferase-like glycosyltransferase
LVEVLFLGLILIVAACLRLYLVGQVPPGPHYDEAAAALDALDVLDGRHSVFSLRSYGREMLFAYVAAPLVALLGPTRLALRLPVAIAGILTVLITYLLARELFDEEGRRQAQWTGFLAAMFLALSFWHLVLNHLGFRANYLPLVEILCFLFLFRALRTGRLTEYVLSGFFLGLSLHTYTAAWFVPVVVVIFLGMLLITRTGRTLVLPSWHRWVLLAFVALLVSAPLLVFFVTDPGVFLLRAKGLSIFNPQIHHGDFFGLLGRSLLGNLAQFGFRGDENWVYNIPGRPALGPIQAVLFWLGVVLCLVRWRRPRYLFLLLWWLVMLLPGVLAPVPIPHSLRVVGTLPVACILSARSLAWLLGELPTRFQRLRTAMLWAVPILLLCYLAWAGYNTWHDYFRVWLPRDEVYHAYYGHMADLAEQINRDMDLGGVYVFPVNYDRRGEAYHEYTLELLHRGPVPFRYILVDEASVVRDLRDICADKCRVHLIAWTHGDHVDADPRELLPFLLERCGRKTETRFFRGYRIVTYALTSSGVDFMALPDPSAARADFGNNLRLVAQAHEPCAPSGGTTLAVLQWQVQQEMAQDYTASLRLLDGQGHLVGQRDTPLLSNEHRPTSLWEPGKVVKTYHQVPIRPAALPGTHELHLALYEPGVMSPVPLVREQDAHAGARLVLGTVEIGRPLGGSTVEPEVPFSAAALAPGIELVGYGLDRELVVPRETMCLALYWHATVGIARDYRVIIQLVDGKGYAVVEWAGQPVYPTSQWQAGDVWRDWHDLKVPSGVPLGEYQLVVCLAVADAAELAHTELRSVEIQGRDCLFQMPAIGHPMAARLGDTIRLLGYDFEEERVRAGGTLCLTLYWQAVAECDVSYTVFTHLLDESARICGQKDGLPAGGALPTTLWVPQEIIVDQYEIPVSADAPSGEYLVEVGMYEAASGQRLGIRDEGGEAHGDHILLDRRIFVTR